LDKHNVQNQVVTCVGEFSPSGIALMLAVIANDNVFTPTTSNSIILKNILSISQSNFLIDVHSKVITKVNDGKPNNEFIVELITNRKHPGLILFSSGSTGFPKAAIHDFVPLLEKYTSSEGLKKITSMAFLLFDHIGGINTVFYNLFSKGILVIPTNRASDYILSLVEKYHVELLPTTPSFLNLLLLNKTYLNFNLSSLKTISYGTEPMPITTLEALNKAFPNIYFKQTYGLTEVGIIRTKSESSNSLWLKLGDESHQIQIRDGILWIKSKMSMLGYLNSESPFDSEGWFNTKDKVEVKGEYIKILGRASELINVGGQKVFPTEIENVVLEVPGVIDVLAYGSDNSIMGKVVNLKVYTTFENTVELSNQIKKYCTEKLEKYKRPVKIEFVSSSFESERFKKKRV
jgi:long-chain acyl-CoA synthetase